MLLSRSPRVNNTGVDLDVGLSLILGLGLGLGLGVDLDAQNFVVLVRQYQSPLYRCLANMHDTLKLHAKRAGLVRGSFKG